MTDAVTEQIGDEQIFPVATEREARRNAALLRRAQFDPALPGQVTLLELELMHHFIPGPAAQDARPVRRKRQAVERLVHRDARDHAESVRAQVHDDDFVVAVARVEHGGVTPVRRHRDVHWEIRQSDLLANGPQRPLVRQQHHAAAARARQLRETAHQIMPRDHGPRTGTRADDEQEHESEKA